MGTERNKRIDQDGPESPGRVAVDNRGRNVWQWNDDQLDSTTIMLRSLDNASLALEPTRKVRRPDMKEVGITGQAQPQPSRPDRERASKKTSELSVEQTVSTKIGGGFDPYNRS